MRYCRFTHSMGHFLSVIVEGFLSIWCHLLGKQRELDESSKIGQSEFEKEGPGLLWALIIGGSLLTLTVFFVLCR